MTAPKIGDHYRKNGIRIDVEHLGRGWVYYRRWPKGVVRQTFFEHCGKMPVARFFEQIADATKL